jgi:hypothetical protein
MTESLQNAPRPEITSSVDSGDVPVDLIPNGNRLHPHLSYREARQSPCLSCTTSPCCTHLLLTSFRIESIFDIDYAVYLLNFDGIIIGMDAKGKIDVYLHQACHYLDVPSGLCTVHSTPLQPAVCVHYNSHTCGYRSRMIPDVHPDRPLLDRDRMAWFADRVIFDDDRRVIAVPDWQEVLEAFRAMPMPRIAAPPPPPDPVREEWRSIVLSQKSPGGARPIRHFGEPEMSDPCQGCGAWCCQKLVFNRGLPAEASGLDFFRYCLGFPGVEVGIADDSWAVIVNTTCRHLQGNRCSVYGSDERPLKCSYYDALSCSYRPHFGVARPDEIIRLNRDQFRVVLDSIVLNDLGRIVAIPRCDVLRDLVEEAERAGAQPLSEVEVNTTKPMDGRHFSGVQTSGSRGQLLVWAPSVDGRDRTCQ